MKLERIDLVNFGSHAARTWEPGPARLSVIVGPNGAGKSTLLVDGPLFALWGDVPGGYSPDQLVRIGAQDMSVTVEFELDGLRYRVVRRRTTRAGGKSSADLQSRAPDGSWTPVASGAREVSAEVSRILRMDQATFRTAVVLAQGDAKRFMDATAGKGTPTAPGRAAILSTLVVDPRFALAEVRARDEVRDLEARTVAERGQIERLTDAIAELESAHEAKAEAENTIAEWDEALSEARQSRALVAERLVVLAGEIAKGDAAAAEVTRLEAERGALAERYRREKAAIVAADAALGAAQATLAAAGAIESAAEAIGGARAELVAMEGADAAGRRLREEIAAAREAFTALERPHERAVASWTAEIGAARSRVEQLVAAGRALKPVICEKCAHPNIVDQADIRGQLAAARDAVAALEAAEPKAPLEIARQRAGVARLDAKLRDLPGPSEAELREARARLAQLERDAARAGEIDAARRAIETATAARASAEAELETIGLAGTDVATRLATAGAAIAGTATLLAERRALMAEVAVVDDTIERIEQQRRRSADALAMAVANLERQAQLQAEVATVTDRLAAADVEIGRLRRLVGAFGVKGIPARVVESVLPELVAHANDLLGQLRPGMTLDVRATRAKADGSGTIEALDLWIRDRAGERQRWSGGEGTSIAMAIAVALSRLGARRSGARVATLVIDEPDGLDAASRRAFGQALRVLAHRGDLERVAVITHQDGIPDFADAVVEIEPADEASDSIASAAA